MERFLTEDTVNVNTHTTLKMCKVFNLPNVINLRSKWILNLFLSYRQLRSIFLYMLNIVYTLPKLLLISFTNKYAQPLQLCLTLCDPMDCSPPGSSVHEDSPGKNIRVGCHAPLRGLNPGLPLCRQIIYHLSHERRPRTLEWVVYPFSRGSSRPRNQTGLS